jgi:cytochrome c biogenesis factor
MVESVISLLIWICVIGLVFYLVIYVLRDVLGIPIPAKAIQILLVIVGLIVILMLYRLVVSSGGLSVPGLN